eukprot:jgi/Chlat1/5667/Chrsp37S05492
MQLTELNDLLPETAEVLAAAGLASVEDVLLADLEALRVPGDNTADGPQKHQAVAAVMRSLARLCDAGGRDGLQLLATLQATKVYSTGCSSIDNLLQGGLWAGTVTELAGVSSAGKTQICLAAVAKVARQKECTVAYVDTCGAFSARRIAQLHTSAPDKESTESPGKSLNSTLKSIARFQAYDAWSLLELLQQLRKYCAPNSQWEFFRMLRLVVIDSVAAVLSPIVRTGPAGVQGLALFASIGRELRQLAESCQVAVLVTNNAIELDDGETKPALGEVWHSVPHARLLLTRTPGSEECCATLHKHNHVEHGQKTAFSIRREGVVSM